MSKTRGTGLLMNSGLGLSLCGGTPRHAALDQTGVSPFSIRR